MHRALGLGAGVYFISERAANLPNTYKLLGYWRTDAALFYKRNYWKTQVNFINVFYRDYCTDEDAGVFNYTLSPSQPLSVQASITYKF